MKKKLTVYELVLTSIIGAVILILALVPNVGFIQILPGVAVTIMHIPVIIGAFLLGWRENLFLGALFGLSSLLVAATRPTTPFDMAFVNPLISVLPRMLFALCAYFIARLFKKLNDIKYGKQIIFGIITLTTALGLFFGVNHITKEYAYRDYNQTNNEIVNTNCEIILLQNHDDVLQVIAESRSDSAAKKALIRKYKVTSGSLNIYFTKDLSQIRGSTPDNIQTLITTKENRIDELKELIKVKSDDVLADGTLTVEAKERFSNYQKITIPISIVIIIGLGVLYYFFTLKKEGTHTYIASVFIISTIVHTILVISSVLIFNPKVFTETFGNKNIMVIILSIAAFNGVIEAFVGALIGTPIATAALIRKEGNQRWFYYLIVETLILK